MPLCRRPRLSVLCGASLVLAAATMFGSVPARAQIAGFDDPLMPKTQTDPRNPSRFAPGLPPSPAQLRARAQSTQTQTRALLGQSPATPPASGAGGTGFDSTNSRKAQTRKRTTAAARAQALAPGLPEPASASPYQRPAPSGTGAMASAPGAPPVEIGPIRRPLPKRRSIADAEDPYAPLGLRAGSFTLFPAVELIGGYDSNPGRGPAGQAASLYTVAPELRAQSDWSRHELRGELRGSYTGYSPDSEPTLSRPNVNGTLDGRVDVTRTTRVDLGGRVLVSTDNPGSPNLQAGLSKLPIFTTVGGSVGVGQQFNRFQLSVKGDAERTAYQDSELTDGTTFSNEDRNYDQYTGTVRGGYELTPGITPFVEASFDTREHDTAIDASGYHRNSKGVTGKVGSTFEITRTLVGEAAIGYTRRTYDDARFDTLRGLIGSASLVWTVDALTTVKFTGASTVGESNVPGVSGVFYRDAGVQIDHAFRRWLIGSVKLGIGMDTYKGATGEGVTSVDICGCVVSTPGSTVPDREDMRYSAGFGLTYKIDRSVQIKGEFRQDWLRSNVAGVDYTASTVLVGLRWQK